VRALVIAHEPDGGAAQIEVRLLQRGWTVDTHLLTHDYERPNVADALPDLEGYDLIIPMGSIRSLTDKDEIDSWVHDELRALAAAHERGTPILGVCFGGQLMAEALGGRVEAMPSAEIGWFSIDPVDAMADPVVPGPWMQWHHDRFEPPPGAEVLATRATGTQLFRLGTTVGTQFHPEVDLAHIEAVLEQTPDDYRAEHGVALFGIRAEAADRERANIEHCHALVDWFLDDVAFPS
jgi:GMP synthase-like glutamine amidotransferase